MVLLSSQLDNYVIHIIFQLAMYHVMEYGGHCALVSRACIFQPEGHHSMIKIAYGCFESSFLSIFWHYSNLVIFAESIHKGEHGISCGNSSFK